MDFYNNYKAMQSDTSQKMQKSHVIMSIRGLLSSPENDDNNLESISFDDIKLGRSTRTVLDFLRGLDVTYKKFNVTIF